MVVDYQILSGRTGAELQKAVNIMLGRGYEPLGGLAATGFSGGEQPAFFQPVVLIRQDESKTLINGLEAVGFQVSPANGTSPQKGAPTNGVNPLPNGTNKVSGSPSNGIGSLPRLPINGLASLLSPSINGGGSNGRSQANGVEPEESAASAPPNGSGPDEPRVDPPAAEEDGPKYRIS